MTPSPLSPHISRTLACGISLAIISGATLATPAAFAVDHVRLLMHVNTADIAPTPPADEGWYQGYDDVVGGFADVPGGIEITGKSQMLYAIDQPLTLYELSYAVATGDISWSTSAESDPAFYQIAVTFGDDDFTTLRPVTSKPGINQVSGGDIWTFSDDIGSTAAGTELALADIGDLLLAATGPGAEPQITAVGVLTDPGTTTVVTGISWVNSWWELGKPATLEGWAEVTGTPALDQVLTAETGGWPEGTELSYTWLLNDSGHSWEPVNQSHAATITATNKYVGSRVSVAITGTLDGYEPVTVTSALSAPVTAPQRAASEPPVADSSELPAFYAAAAVEPQSQEAVGLPAGQLSPSSSNTATIPWGIGDSFVDVFAYSTPVLVGTYPVVDGVVSVPLTPEILSLIGPGAHSVVLLGQTSSGAKAFEITVAAEPLPATGVDPAPPLAVASVMLLLGATVLLMRRRRTTRV